MKVDKDLVRKVADLANLALKDDEVAHYEKQLGRILDHIAQLSQLSQPSGRGDAKDLLGIDWRGDTKGEPTPERADEPRDSLSPDEALGAAPRKVGSAFQVPRIIEEH